MSSMQHLATVEVEHRTRLFAAMATLAERRGQPAAAPPQLSREPLPTPKSNSDLLAIAILAEAVAALATEVDALSTERNAPAPSFWMTAPPRLT